MLDLLPEDDEARELAYAVVNHMEDAWGVSQRRYLAGTGEWQGQLDPRTIN